MRLTRIVGGALSAGALAGTLFMAAPASALELVPQPAPEAAEVCRTVELEGPFEGITRGECVNILKGRSSENSSNSIAGICGIDFLQQTTGNKGQCVSLATSSNPE